MPATMIAPSATSPVLTVPLLPISLPPVPAAETVRLPGFTTPLELRRFTLEEYEKMVEVGILGEADHLELLHGYLVQKISRNRPHDFGLAQLRDFFSSFVPKGWFVEGQTAIRFPFNKPEPDVIIIRGSRTDFRKQHPNASDVALIVEVADSSLSYDRSDKYRAYAAAGIPQYWIVNIPDRQIEIYTDPVGPPASAAYRQRVDFPESENVPVVLDGVSLGSVPAADILA